MNTYEVEVGGKPLYIQTGVLAQQANGSVTVRQGDTVVLVTAVMSDPREGIDFFPLTVDYEERLYAVGKIPGGFPRREARPSTDAILAMRLTDRPIRPRFPAGFRNDIQIVATTLSADQEHQPDTLITIGASAALTISDIPFNGPVSSVRVARVGDEFIVNPTFAEAAEAELDIIVGGTKDAVVMVEAGAAETTEEIVLEAIEVAMEANKAIIELQEQMAADAAPVKADYQPAPDRTEVTDAVAEYLADRLDEVVATANSERSDANKALRVELTEHFGERFDAKEIADGLYNFIKKSMRNRILTEGKRADGRATEQVRKLDIHVGVLPRTHGSGLFQRGETQVLTIATLAGKGMAQKLDTLSPETTKRYMHHYNFPPYSVGESRPLRGPGRREIGHGALAERALLPVIPDEDEFPYVLRVVSEVMSSNGSTSMASVCGSTLALMDAGVPLLAPVAGVAMGLIMDDDGNYKVLTDIAGAEDFMGDMDFKVAGTQEGITALQMDIKIGGVSREVLTNALEQARQGRLFILNAMTEVIAEPRDDISDFAPKMFRIEINPEQIGTIIGPGGKTIRRIQDETGASIDIDDDGSVFIAATDKAGAEGAMRMIKAMTKDVEAGETYTGKVTRTLNFGFFVEIVPGREGMVRVPHGQNGNDVASVGDEIEVQVHEIDDRGRINLVIAGQEAPPPRPSRRDDDDDDSGGGGGERRSRNRGGRDRGGRGGDRGDRGDRGGRDRGGDRSERNSDRGDRGDRSERQPRNTSGRSGGRGGDSGGRSQRYATNGPSRTWVRRDAGIPGEPPPPPPPPRPDLGGSTYFDED